MYRNLKNRLIYRQMCTLLWAAEKALGTGMWLGTPVAQLLLKKSVHYCVPNSIAWPIMDERKVISPASFTMGNSDCFYLQRTHDTFWGRIPLDLSWASLICSTDRVDKLDDAEIKISGVFFLLLLTLAGIKLQLTKETPHIHGNTEIINTENWEWWSSKTVCLTYPTISLQHCVR